jgi:hypothetical protein
MYTFLAIVGSKHGSGPMLERARRVSKEVMPTAQAEVTFRLTSVAGMGGGWFYSLPEPSPHPPLIS